MRCCLCCHARRCTRTSVSTKAVRTVTAIIKNITANRIREGILSHAGHIVLGHRNVVHRYDRAEADRRRAAINRAVVRDVGQCRDRAGVVLGRFERDVAVGLDRDRANRGAVRRLQFRRNAQIHRVGLAVAIRVDRRRSYRQRVLFRVAVVAQHVLRHRAVFRHRDRVIDAHRGVVHRRDIDRQRRGIRTIVTVAHRISNDGNRAGVILGWHKGVAAIGVDGDRPHPGYCDRHAYRLNTRHARDGVACNAQGISISISAVGQQARPGGNRQRLVFCDCRRFIAIYWLVIAGHVAVSTAHRIIDFRMPTRLVVEGQRIHRLGDPQQTHEGRTATSVAAGFASRRFFEQGIKATAVTDHLRNLVCFLPARENR